MKGNGWELCRYGSKLIFEQHLHDGGVAVDLLASPSQMVCTTRLNYAESPSFIFRGTLMGNDKPAVNHISSVERCNVGNGAAGGVKEMRKYQAWIVKGRYNYDERPGNIEEGKQGAVMAISIVLIAVPPGGVPSPGQGWIGWAGSMVGIGGGSSAASPSSGGSAVPGELSPAAPKPVWDNGPQAPPGPEWKPVPSVPGPVSVAGSGGEGDFAPGMGF